MDSEKLIAELRDELAHSEDHRKELREALEKSEARAERLATAFKPILAHSRIRELAWGYNGTFNNAEAALAEYEAAKAQ